MVLFLVPFMSLKSIQKEREYTKFVVDERLCYYEPSKNKTEKTFVEELSSSLNQKQKSIHPKFFYDKSCLLYTSPSPRDRTRSRMPSSA